jgi:putative endonuclease
MYTIYAIYNANHKKIYIGQCSDLQTRLELHSKKSFKTSYTAKFTGSWILIYSEEAANRTDALKREKQLKSYRGRGFIKKYIPG